ncbi:MAG: RluA family pseudouridine synthase [Candidatus Kapabacteria bacterium]|nr:RluA family pseudouridine synthase [Candidatus Kapabacteria bacterium]
MDENINYPDYIESVFEFKVTAGQNPQRLDVYLVNSIKNATRTKVQKAIDEGFVTINGKVTKGSKKVQPGDLIICKLLKPPPIELIPEDIPLNIIFEDEYLILVNKPSGMVSHPGFGNRSGTLVNALLYHLGHRDRIKIEIEEDDEESNDEGKIFASDSIRPGLVHRLDKDTSGIMLIAKNPEIHSQLAKQFAERTVEKKYLALVWGKFDKTTGRIEGDIGRSSLDRKLFAVVKKGGKPAITEYKVLEEFEYLSLVEVNLLTGRTHQIRVHFSHIKHPVFGDIQYGGNKIVYGYNNKKLKELYTECLKMANNQQLHSFSLSFEHPITKQKMKFEAELPITFSNIIQKLKKS